jgi:thiol-disulfide isomerase/thioredoxin
MPSRKKPVKKPAQVKFDRFAIVSATRRGPDQFPELKLKRPVAKKPAETKQASKTSAVPKADRLVVVSGSWCVYCQMLEPELEKLEKKHGIAFEVLDYDDDKHRSLELVEAESADSLSLPTIVGFRNGRKVFIEEGYMSCLQLERFLGLRPAPARG